MLSIGAINIIICLNRTEQVLGIPSPMHLQIYFFFTELRKGKHLINKLRGHFVPGYVHGGRISFRILES